MAFRSHYEKRHVPLGLSFIDHFRWRKYIRNYVIGPVQNRAGSAGGVDFDCMTEFWVADRRDQERTAQFVNSAEFSVLDKDDRRFLDVTKRLSFEVEENLLFESKSHRDSSDVERLAQFLEKPEAMSAPDFASEVVEHVRVFVSTHEGICDKVTLDVRQSSSSEIDGLHAILSVWPSDSRAYRTLAWPEIGKPAAIVRLESVESASEILFA